MDPIVTIIRPDLSPEEREKRIEEIKQQMIDFWIVYDQQKGGRT